MNRRSGAGNSGSGLGSFITASGPYAIPFVDADGNLALDKYFFRYYPGGNLLIGDVDPGDPGAVISSTPFAVNRDFDSSTGPMMLLTNRAVTGTTDLLFLTNGLVQGSIMGTLDGSVDVPSYMRGGLALYADTVLLVGDKNRLYQRFADGAITQPGLVVKERIADGTIPVHTFVKLSTATAGRVVAWTTGDNVNLIHGIGVAPEFGDTSDVTTGNKLRVVELRNQTVYMKTDGVNPIAKGVVVKTSTSSNGRISGAGGAGSVCGVAEEDYAGGVADTKVLINFKGV